MKRRLVISLLALLFALSACSNSTDSDNNASISEVQGCTHVSPYDGKYVKEVLGIVTKKYENGFVIQSTHPDDQICSSEAIFIFTSNYSDVQSGDQVSVSGKVQEYVTNGRDSFNLSQTEITDAKVRIMAHSSELLLPVLLGAKGYPMPEKTIEDDAMETFDPLNDGLDYFESLEWMRVKLPRMRVVGPRNPYNEIVVVEVSGDEGQRSGYTLNGDRGNLHPERIMIQLPASWTRKVNVGDVLEEGTTGILNYSYGNYKIEPVNEVRMSQLKDEDENGFDSSAKLRIATYNLFNFSQFSQHKKIESLADQIVNTLQCPDLIVFQEIQDDSGEEDNGITAADANLFLLSDEIQNVGGVEYSYYYVAPENNSSGGVAGGNIRTVFFLRNDSELKLDKSMDYEKGKNSIGMKEDGSIYLFPNPQQLGLGVRAFENVRKPIAGLFHYGNTEIVVIGVHFVSKGLDSPLFGSLQPKLEPELEKRLEEARFVNQWAEKLLELSPETLVIVAGDINSGYDSEVSDALAGNSFIDTASQLPEGERFSILNDGLAFLFDHILISNPSIGYDASVFHLNSLFDSDSSPSDHDPVMIAIDLPREGLYR